MDCKLWSNNCLNTRAYHVIVYIDSNLWLLVRYICESSWIKYRNFPKNYSAFIFAHFLQDEVALVLERSCVRVSSIMTQPKAAPLPSPRFAGSPLASHIAGINRMRPCYPGGARTWLWLIRSKRCSGTIQSNSPLALKAEALKLDKVCLIIQMSRKLSTTGATVDHWWVQVRLTLGRFPSSISQEYSKLYSTKLWGANVTNILQAALK